jgi:hypothetical protein
LLLRQKAAELRAFPASLAPDTDFPELVEGPDLFLAAVEKKRGPSTGSGKPGWRIKPGEK